MQARNTAPSIPLAHGGPITDQMLEQMLPQARALQQGDDAITTEFGMLMMSSFAPIVEELLRRRRAMEVIADVTDIDNVLFFRGGN